MKKIISLFVLFLFPFFLHAQEATTTVENITVNLNLRYKSSLVFSAPVTIQKNSSVNLNDSSGGSHPIPSDSALSALSNADLSSDSFSISDLNYYNDFSSFFINCIDVASPSTHACGNWQYVVNSFYPPVGADKYVLSNNDTIYFYFGNARRVSFSTPTIEVNKPISIKSETYDYINDSWVPVGNMLIGATQPNPTNPYSPSVLFTTTSDSAGNASLLISTPGSYNVGLDSDYYYPTEPITVTDIIQTTQSVQTTASSGSGGSSSARREIAKQAEINIIDEDSVEIVNDITVKLDSPIDDFIKRYNKISKNSKFVSITRSPIQESLVRNTVSTTGKTKINSQVASVINSVDTTNVKPVVKNWFEKFLSLISF